MQHVVVGDCSAFACLISAKVPAIRGFAGASGASSSCSAPGRESGGSQSASGLPDQEVRMSKRDRRCDTSRAEGQSYALACRKAGHWRLSQSSKSPRRRGVHHHFDRRTHGKGGLSKHVHARELHRRRSAPKDGGVKFRRTAYAQTDIASGIQAV